MTNILSTIVLTLLTNTVTTDNSVPATHRGYPISRGDTIDWVFDAGKPATERYTTVTVTERKELVSTVDGKEFRSLVSERIILSKVATQKKFETWLPESVQDNTFERTNIVSVLSTNMVFSVSNVDLIMRGSIAITNSAKKGASK